MDHFDFEILQGDRKIAARSERLADARLIWPKIIELARSVGEAGDRIRVINGAGEVTVRMGVKAARLMAENPAAIQKMTRQ